MRFGPLVFAALLLPLPAAAQSLGRYAPPAPSAPRASSWGGYRPERVVRAPEGLAVRRDLRNVRSDIREARRSGQLSRREARALLRESARIEARTRRMARDGLSDPESGFLAGQVEGLRAETASTTRRR